MAYVRNWNGDLVEVTWVYCNHCGTQFVEDVYEGKCPVCGKFDDFCTEDEVRQAEAELFDDKDEDLEVLEQAMEMNAGAFYDRMDWSGD